MNRQDDPLPPRKSGQPPVVPVPPGEPVLPISRQVALVALICIELMLVTFAWHRSMAIVIALAAIGALMLLAGLWWRRTWLLVFGIGLVLGPVLPAVLVKLW